MISARQWPPRGLLAPVSPEHHPTVSPERAVALGAYVHGAPWNLSAVEEFERLAERRLQILMWYQDWATTRDLDTALLQRVRARGCVPMITWDPWDYQAGKRQPDYALERIVAREFDDYIRSWATALGSDARPLLLRWGHEMNGRWYPWGTNGRSDGAKYRAAWQHAWRLFDESGASNVRWVWSPNIVHGAAAFEPFFPGDGYVDLVGLDGYNWGGRDWKPFVELFGPSYERLIELTQKPVMIAETGCAEDRRKPAWIEDAFGANGLGQLTRVEAVIWFHQTKERDWRIDSSPESRAAFARAVTPGAPRHS